MNHLIARHWHSEERRLPGINCIVFPDGNITILNCCSLYDPNNGKKEFFCRPLCDTTIDSIEKYDAAYWTLVDEWSGIDYRGGRIYGGDGQMGNEGFIACVDSKDDLLWGIFFENSNPIKSLAIKDDTLIAINEHAELRIEIDLENLTSIKMTAIEKDG